MTKTALITGTTCGIGEAAVRTFVAAGWRVIATGRRRDRLEALVASLGRAWVYPAAFAARDESARDASLASVPGPDILRAGDAREMTPGGLKQRVWAERGALRERRVHIAGTQCTRERLGDVASD
jgi:NAD(P)-dependent dehydrogenase (short-subunit alcohol dehydrogenase family)